MDGNSWPVLETTAELAKLCYHHSTIPTSYELKGVMREGDHSHRISKVINIWKGSYEGKAVELKVLDMSRHDPHILEFKRVSILCKPPGRVVVRCCPDGYHSAFAREL